MQSVCLSVCGRSDFNIYFSDILKFIDDIPIWYSMDLTENFMFRNKGSSRNRQMFFDVLRLIEDSFSKLSLTINELKLTSVELFSLFHFIIVAAGVS